MKQNPRQIAIAGLIAAIYVLVTITPGISAISYGHIQFRIAEALTLLPFIYPGAIIGLFAGCLLANIFGPVGIQDIIFGSLLTLIAAWLTYVLRKTKKPYIAAIPPIIINAFGVSAYLHYFFEIPYWLCVFQIFIGQTVVCYLLGLPLLKYILKREKGFN